ncbi:MAG: DUF3488 and transglutaminase-like domain-containing protein [Actinobacteria bacterium]|nr:DUF3488 and transglutaminase-like domain-containing protein [Actinomycetota bacterium]
MATTLPPDTELTRLETEAIEHLAEEEGHVVADLDAAEGGIDGDDDELVEDASPGQSYRLAAAVACPTIGLAVMVGGVFTGAGARVYAVVAGLLGIGLAVLVQRQRRPLLANTLIVVGLFTIGLMMVVPSGIAEVPRVRDLVGEAARTADLSRPPVGLRAGWQAIIGWLMGIVGFTAAWLALVVRRPALALLVPLPITAIPAISVPEEQQVASGIAALVLFAIGLGLLSSAQSADVDEDERPSRAYEMRRALRALPLIAFITVALAVLAQSDFLFPDPYIDPTEEPQRPKTVPLSEVEDRVLFSVEADFTGPWRIGNLDVYDGKDWRLPPFAANRLDDVPRSGIVDPELEPGVRARFTVSGLGGAVLPALPNTVGIIAEGPRLAYDSRNGNIRVSEGQVQAGLSYTVTAAGLPTVDALKALPPFTPDGAVAEFTEIPDPPDAVVDLLAQAPQTSQWETFDFVRQWVLNNVVAAGPGVPVSITPERVGEMLSSGKEGTPFEIVAAQAMLARWVGLPSRIGYGFDGGELIDGKLQVRPRHGANFVEVWFPGFKWLPVIGTPAQARPTVGSDATQQQFDPSILPSDEVSVGLFVPLVVEGKTTTADSVRRGILLALPVVLLLLLAYAAFPALSKAYKRARRRSAARAAGPHARVALAYAEWRDHAADFGYAYATDTPLMFLDRFVEDEEHTELAWLVTRALWGDLRHNLSLPLADAAEELSRALRRRLSQSQPATARAVAAVSRTSLRHPYAPETDLTDREEAGDAPLVPVPAHA